MTSRWPRSCYKHIAPVREPAWTEYLTSSFSFFFSSFSFFRFSRLKNLSIDEDVTHDKETWHVHRLFDWIRFTFLSAWSINQNVGKRIIIFKKKEFDLSKHLIGFWLFSLNRYYVYMTWAHACCSPRGRNCRKQQVLRARERAHSRCVR